MTRLLLQLFGATLVCLAAAGCMHREEPTPPFRVEATGPGLELRTEGARVEVFDESGERYNVLRLTNNGVRIFDGDNVRIGRVRSTESGWELVNREGDTLCVLSESEGVLTSVCGDTAPLTVAHVDDTWSVHIADELRWTVDGTMATEPNNTDSDIAVRRANVGLVVTDITRGDLIADVRGARATESSALFLAMAPVQANSAAETRVMRATLAWWVWRTERTIGAPSPEGQAAEPASD